MQLKSKSVINWTIDRLRCQMIICVHQLMFHSSSTGKNILFQNRIELTEKYNSIYAQIYYSLRKNNFSNEHTNSRWHKKS